MKPSTTDRQAAELVKLQYFVGLTLTEAAQIMGVSTRTADRLWAYARAWLHQELRDVSKIFSLLFQKLTYPDRCHITAYGDGVSPSS
jgi:hypothetical protein